VFLDGREAFSVSQGVAARLGLEVGVVLGEADVATIAVDAARDRAKEAALRLLAVRARSRNELLDRLKRKGFDPGVAAEVVGGLEGAGLIDDPAFARLWADERMRLRPVGPRRLRHELLEKGLAPALVDETVAEVFLEHSEIDVARRAIAKRTRRTPAPSRARELARLRSFLLRRGFSYETTREVLRELSEGLDE
jgi:regulatory protein